MGEWKIIIRPSPVTLVNQFLKSLSYLPMSFTPHPFNNHLVQLSYHEFLEIYSVKTKGPWLKMNHTNAAT